MSVCMSEIALERKLLDQFLPILLQTYRLGQYKCTQTPAYMIRAASLAADQTLTEGEQEQRMIRDWVYPCISFWF